MVRFEDVATGSTFGHTGPSLAALIRSKWINNQRDWSISTRWYRPVELWVSISFACHMLEAIWSIGRARFRGGGDVTTLPPLSLDDVS